MLPKVFIIWIIQSMLFGETLILTCKYHQESTFLENDTFWDLFYMNWFDLEKFPKAPFWQWCSRRGFFIPLELHFWMLGTCSTWKNCTFAHIWSFVHHIDAVWAHMRHMYMFIMHMYMYMHMCPFRDPPKSSRTTEKLLRAHQVVCLAWFLISCNVLSLY